MENHRIVNKRESLQLRLRYQEGVTASLQNRDQNLSFQTGGGCNRIYLVSPHKLTNTYDENNKPLYKLILGNIPGTRGADDLDMRWGRSSCGERTASTSGRFS